MNITQVQKWKISLVATALWASLALQGCSVKTTATESTDPGAVQAVEVTSPPATSFADTNPAAVVVTPTSDAQKTPEGVPDAFAVPPAVVLPATEVKSPTAEEVVKPVEVQVWFVSPSDLTIRDALTKWAASAGYTFGIEHWTVPFDLPVTASATFSGDFKTAVRRLIATTELSDQPLQPCFYPNQVVRIVPFNQICNPFTAR